MRLKKPFTLKKVATHTNSMISGLFISKEICFPKALKKYQTLKRILFSFKETLKALLCKCY